MKVWGVSVAPAWILSFVLAGACAALFKLVLGHRARGLFPCWIISLAGFFAAQVISENLGASSQGLPLIGDVYIVQDCLASLLFLAVGGRAKLW